MMRRLAECLAVGLVACALPHGSLLAQQGASVPAQFIGTWRLVSLSGDSATLLRVGRNPTGLIVYDGSNHMAVQIQPDRQRTSWSPSRSPTASEALDAVVGYVAYFGTYAVDTRSQTVTHHREGALNLDAVDYVRRYEFLPNGRLALTPVDRPGVRLVWERVK